MSDINLVVLSGRFGTEPELKNAGVSKVCKVSFAVDQSYKDSTGTKVDNTEWLKLESWGRLAEIMHDYGAKGRQALIKGKIKTNKYTDKEGNNRTMQFIVVTECKFTGSLPKQEKKVETKKENYKVVEQPAITQDDIPF